MNSTRANCNCYTVPSPGPKGPTSPRGRGKFSRYLSRRRDLDSSALKPAELRRGQSLVEFAVVALVLYMLLAATLTFGHMLYVAQGLQSAADLAARELSRTPLAATLSFEDALNQQIVLDTVFDPHKLVYRITPGENFYDAIQDWPVLNKQLAPLMIVDGPFIRYPGALLQDPDAPTGFTVGIPLTSSASDGSQSIRWVPVVEEIKSVLNESPFRVSSRERGIVALRINYPFQSASMSSFRANPAGPFEPTIGSPNLANDGSITETNTDQRPGALTGSPLVNGDMYSGTYGGQYGLGAQGTLGQVVRPYRRVITAQAIYRREVFE